MTLNDDINKQASIGVCWMEPDGTIKLQLSASEPGMRGEALLVYAPTQNEYMEILRHVGPLTPGEKKSVAPFPM